MTNQNQNPGQQNQNPGQKPGQQQGGGQKPGQQQQDPNRQGQRPDPRPAGTASSGRELSESRKVPPKGGTFLLWQPHVIRVTRQVCRSGRADH